MALNIKALSTLVILALSSACGSESQLNSSGTASTPVTAAEPAKLADVKKAPSTESTHEGMEILGTFSATSADGTSKVLGYRIFVEGGKAYVSASLDSKADVADDSYPQDVELVAADGGIYRSSTIEIKLFGTPLVGEFLKFPGATSIRMLTSESHNEVTESAAAERAAQELCAKSPSSCYSEPEGGDVDSEDLDKI